MNHQKTPLFDALHKHNEQRPISFHVPGHKNGEVFLAKAEAYYRSMLSIDVTELSGLDDLHSPEGVIQEAETLLADAYKTKNSFFLINGSTVGNLTMILSSFQEDDIVFVQRNCHKSILNGLKLAKLVPVFIEPIFNEEWKVAVGITKDSLVEAYRSYPNGKGVILTYPNYYGFTYNVKEIIDFCHSNEMVVLVDEAHGAHFIAGNPFPTSSLQLGADMVVQSAHKTLPAMTMSAYLHLNSNRISIDTVRTYLQVLQSSSPSYPLMASLDLARSYVATYDEEDKNHLMREIELFLGHLKETPQINVLHHRLMGDPLKISIQSKQGISGFDLQKRMESIGIYTELADPYNVLLVFPLLKSGECFPLIEVINRMKEALQGEVETLLLVEDYYRKGKQAFSSLAIGYKEQIKTPSHVIPIRESIGENSAEMVIPYPPGIPLLMEGEKITLEKMEELLQLIHLGARFHGGQYLMENKIKVYG